MPDPARPARAFPASSPSPDAPHDTCVRCGKPTPLGVALCEDDNPGRIGAPSATQVHGTIVAGIVVGFVLIAVLGRLAFSGIGPFEGTVVGRGSRSDGGAEIVVQVKNQGAREAPSTCRVSRGGLHHPDDLVFVTEPIPPGGTRTFPRTVPPPGPRNEPLVVERLSVRCS